MLVVAAIHPRPARVCMTAASGSSTSSASWSTLRNDDGEVVTVRLRFEFGDEIFCGGEGFGAQNADGAFRRDELRDRLAEPCSARTAFAFDHHPFAVAVTAFDLLTAAPERTASTGQSWDRLARRAPAFFR